MTATKTLPSDRVAIVDVIDPDVTIASTVEGAWIDLADFDSVMGIILFGTAGSSATLDAKFEQATSSGGAGAKDITGKSVTQMLVSDKQAIVNVRSDELDVAGGFAFVRFELTVAVATSDVCAIVLGLDGRHQPASDNDASSVVEIV